MRLRRSDCTAPGITRRRSGRGFVYVDHDGSRITDAQVVGRIRDLTIPPAWTDVWICPWPNGHIQAVGTDAAGRKQYRYHDLWRVRRDIAKFDHMLDFARALPDLRGQISQDLQRNDIDRDRVLACAVRLLDLGFFRIGSEGYAQTNRTYGLATIRKDHVSIRGELVRFDYVAKSGQRRLQSVVDPDVVTVIRALKRRRAGGPELLAYRRDGTWVDVRSADINGYVKDVTGGDFTAKDFRTWSATVLVAVALGVSSEATTASERRRAVTRALHEAAHYLGNTPAVCRSSYVDPRVVDRYLAGSSIHSALGRLGAGTAPGHLGTHGEVEAAVLELLADAPPASSLLRAS